MPEAYANPGLSAYRAAAGARQQPVRSRSVASLKRWTRLLAGPALALAATAAAVGCTSSPAAAPKPATGTSTDASPAAPDLTTARAREIFNAYVATTAKAARTTDSALALSVVTGVQQSTLAAALKGTSISIYIRSSAQGAYSNVLGGGPGYGLFTYSTPTFYLPEQAGYPRFFVVGVTRTFPGTKPADGLVTRVGGTTVPVDGPALMLFDQASANTPWLLASTSQFSSGLTLPRLATDKNGQIPQVPPSATALLAQPDVTGPLQGAVVDDGPTSAATKAVAAGPLTTGVYQAALDHVEGLTAPRGDIYQWDLEGTPYPAFALRTASGGALVLYTMYLNSTVAVPDVINKVSPVLPGLPIKVPADFLSLLPAGKGAPRKSLEVQDLLSFAAIDPPAAPAKVTVIAIGGGSNYATAS
jgi:hypothetical protein